MDITSIFDMAREQAGGVTSQQFPDATLLKYANIAYKKFANALIRKVNENYFYDILKANTVAGQNEYTFQATTGTTVGIKKMITCNIKWKSTDTYYSKLPESSTNLSTQSIDELAANNNVESFVQIRDGSIFIYPAPTESIVGGLMVEAIVTLPDLTVTSVEADIFPFNTELRDYHEIIAYGIVPYIYGKLKQTNEKISAINEFNNEISTMCDEVSDRFNNDLQATLPNGNIYK